MESELKEVEKVIFKKLNIRITSSEVHSAIVLEGNAANWHDVVEAGKIAANRGFKGVVNRIEAEEIKVPEIRIPDLKDDFLEGKKVDVLVIGAGIIGSAIARELSKWDISLLVVDKEDDVAMHASSRNDGMIHPGIEPKTGSKRAEYNVRGNRLYTKVTRELDVPFKRCGSIILYDKRWMHFLGPLFLRKARLNGVEGVKLLSYKEVKEREPNVTDDIMGGVFLSSTGILSPFKMAIAYAENAVINGGEISLNTIVQSMKMEKDKITYVQTNRGTIYPRLVINAAGVFADKIADMAGDRFFTIHPRKGEVIFLDNKKGYLLNSVIAKPDFRTLGSETKGGGLVKTIDGNILVGPDAYEQPYCEDYATNRSNIRKIMDKHLPLVPKLSQSDVITYCSGIRAATYEEDFIIEQSEYVKNLVHAAGIQSPGLASAPAIAEDIEAIAVKILKTMKDFKLKENWNPFRKGIPETRGMDFEERSKLIKKKPEYGEIICRCEEVSRGEIMDAINSPIPAVTADAVKRRVRTGMGRCQGGFCLPHIMEIIHDEGKLAMTLITKKGNGSYILEGETKSETER